ncbi:MAG: UpxY family transcription antiterminator [Ferruginibacter sp.]
MSSENRNWYVVYTRPRWEKKVAALLQAKDIEHYCPLNRVLKQWSDRKKVILEPLFKGYIFVKLDEATKWNIKNIEGIINFVYWLGKPAIVREDEIDTIKKFLREFNGVEVVERQLNVHSRVLVKQGVLMNYRGIIIEITGSKARVNIESMGIQLSAVFDKKNLEPI